MAHYCSNLLSPGFLYVLTLCFHTPHYLLYQAAQLTHIFDEKMKELSEDVKREKALKDVAEAMMKEKVKAAETTEKKATMAEKARASIESKSAESEVR